ncbi:hypothetical protein KP509_18G063000 [Ceratopteris richardii]|uniref:SCP domain-containing protein n=2 Tax=Ceratopteris richardii TaxID=49495 RepID=A0A8T2STX2_CERRI|nr:hypothetical protein KP509_18G062900 [Ceratopteris richardii]KAH7366089.1 hypothetical protein KP509_18G063000 [Ceratopteris richardii]
MSSTPMRRLLLSTAFFVFASFCHLVSATYSYDTDPESYTPYSGGDDEQEVDYSRYSTVPEYRRRSSKTYSSRYSGEYKQKHSSNKVLVYVNDANYVNSGTSFSRKVKHFKRNAHHHKRKYVLATRSYVPQYSENDLYSPTGPSRPSPAVYYDDVQNKTQQSPSSDSSYSGSSSSFSPAADEWLSPHNAARAEVGVQPLIWSEEVAQYAQNWADQRKAAGCGMEHSNGPYGENIFWGSGPGYGPAECVASWLSEKENYNYADNACDGGQCYHYTQIVWASTARLGCAKAQCDDGSVFMTCNYDPPGNDLSSRPY